jgi:multidrug efflux pump subunit AcrA (membrane-fusion protein)
MRFKLLIQRSMFVGVLLATGLAGCKKKAEETPDVVVPVKAEHPAVGEISEEIAADAILAPLAQAALSPRISSPIRAEYVRRGARVRQGQLLLTLEDRDLQGTAQDTKGSLTSAEAAYATATKATIPEEAQKAELDVRQAKAELDVANRTRDERKRLLDQGALSGRDADAAYAAAVQAQAAYDAAVKHLQSVERTTNAAGAKAAEGQLASAKGRYINAEAQVGYASLRSPIDGVVTDRPLFPGETAVAGSSVVTVMNTSSLLAKLHVAQATAQKLKVGSDAKVHVPGVEDAIGAKVSFISPALDVGSTTIEVWLKLPNADGRFKVGTPVHAVIRGETVADATQIPASAVVPAQDGSTSVMVIAPDGTARKRAVKVGIRTPEKVQILSGVSPKDNVITEGGYGLDDGTKVSLEDAKGAAEEKDK